MSQFLQFTLVADGRAILVNKDHVTSAIACPGNPEHTILTFPGDTSQVDSYIRVSERPDAVFAALEGP